jgi:CRISPR-associated protein Csd2
MAPRGLYVFEHENMLGNSQAHRLFEQIRIERQEPGKPPRSFSDYQVSVDEDALPSGVTLHRLIG